MIRSERILSTEVEITRYCPETGDEVDVSARVCGTWFPGEPGTYWDPPIPPGVEDLWLELNGRDVPPASNNEADWLADHLMGEA